ncbi:unnamed protein product [Urochloa decumbens]|uniref:Cyanobacterial aminoacyl-tRNA synthetase CAAD domain-containing protein n=1 Tax=Urochloa decumbens TaxID=240449 RepID=A0ABC9DGR2_9POAL
MFASKSESEATNDKCPKFTRANKKQRARWAQKIRPGNERPSMDFEDREAANGSQASGHVCAHRSAREDSSARARHTCTITVPLWSVSSKSHSTREQSRRARAEKGEAKSAPASRKPIRVVELLVHRRQWRPRRTRWRSSAARASPPPRAAPPSSFPAASAASSFASKVSSSQSRALCSQKCFRGTDGLWRFSVADAPRLSLLRVKAASEDTSASGDELIEDLKAKWDAVEDKPTVLLYGGGAVVALWLTSVVVGAINAVPLLPKLLELVGLGYTGWFVYRYLLFKESRKELATDIETLKKKIAGTE